MCNEFSSVKARAYVDNPSKSLSRGAPRVTYSLAVQAYVNRSRSYFCETEMSVAHIIPWPFNPFFTFIKRHPFIYKESWSVKLSWLPTISQPLHLASSGTDFNKFQSLIGIAKLPVNIKPERVREKLLCGCFYTYSSFNHTVHLPYSLSDPDLCLVIWPSKDYCDLWSCPTDHGSWRSSSATGQDIWNIRTRQTCTHTQARARLKEQEVHRKLLGTKSLQTVYLVNRRWVFRFFNSRGLFFQT